MQVLRPVDVDEVMFPGEHTFIREGRHALRIGGATGVVWSWDLGFMRWVSVEKLPGGG